MADRPSRSVVEAGMTDRTVAYELGEFRLDPVARVFTRRDQPIALAPKSFDLLTLLIERRGRVLERGELIRELWPDTIVEEANVTFQVSTLRKALGEDGSKWIETVPKHGYRFTAPVREVRPEDTQEGEALPVPPAGPVRPGPPVWRSATIGLSVVAAVAAFLVLWYASRPDAPVSSEIRLEPVPFTSYPGREAEPTFSPDGSQVAFTWDGENRDNRDIYVKSIGSAQPHRLTLDPARDGSPAWSPNGTRIAFLRDKPGGGSEVRLISPTGGADGLLSEIRGVAIHGLSWSPDGEDLAVVDSSSSEEPLGIYLLNVKSGVKRRVTTSPPFVPDQLPAFSPDGRTIAFNRTPLFGPGPHVHTVSLAGAEPRQLVPTRFPRGRLAWISGGKEILFAAIPTVVDGSPPRPSASGLATASLWRVIADSGAARPLAGTENAVDVTISADGRRFVYSQLTTMDLDIWRLDLQPGPAAAAAPIRFMPSTKADANPQFSPDGEQVAFTSDRSGERAIWVVDGQEKSLKLTSFGASPRWSHDGKEIAFNGPGENKDTDIYVISASGGPARKVTTSPAIDVVPSWSRDGHWIYFRSNRNGSFQVWKVPSSGEQAGAARQVTRGGGFAPIEATNGYVYFARSDKDNQRQSLWRIPVEGGDEEVVVKEYRSSTLSWDLTDQGLYFVDQESSSSGTSWVVRFQRFDRRHATEVARLPLAPFLGGPAISISPDGRWMLSTQTEEESDLMLVEKFR